MTDYTLTKTKFVPVYSGTKISGESIAKDRMPDNFERVPGLTVPKLSMMFAAPTINVARIAWSNRLNALIGAFLVAVLNLFNVTDIIFMSLLIVTCLFCNVVSRVTRKPTEFGGADGPIRLVGYLLVLLPAYILGALPLRMHILSLTVTLKDVVLWEMIIVLGMILLDTLELTGVKVPGDLRDIQHRLSFALSKGLRSS